MTAAGHQPGHARVATGGARRLALLGGSTSWGDVSVALRHLLLPTHLVHGGDIGTYEAAFAERIGVRAAFSFLAGRIGLYGILRALEIGAGDEVLLQVPTHVVVANAIRYTGATPVYVDCCLDTFNIDLDQAERAITPRTKALLLQHTFGLPADMTRATELARHHNLALIEDCVHALGASYQGRPIGSFGRASFFSTEETKTISTTMGGMAVTDDEAVAERLRAFQAGCRRPAPSLAARHVLKLVVYHLLTQPRIHRFSRPLYERLGSRNPLPGPTARAERAGMRPAGYERRLGNAQAALGLRQLRRLESNVSHRRKIAAIYRERLAAHGIVGTVPPQGAEAAFVRYPVWVSDRAEAVARVRPHAVAGTWFNSILGESISPTVAGYRPGSCPRAEAAVKHLVNLPTHERVSEADAALLADLLVPVARNPSAD